MHLPEQIYCWLVATKIINNEGQVDEHRNVQLSSHVSNNLDNGFIIGEVIRRIITITKGKVPTALLNVKSENSKNTKLTNWNFIWLTFDTIGIKLDNRIKQLILSGQTALIIQVLRQLHQLQPQKLQPYHFTVKQKPASSPKKVGSQAVDVKKINLNKDPSESESSLEFLILLLKASLGMTLQQILGLFTNQNKLLSQIIVKGINQSYDSMVLFYTLLSKHSEKLKNFHQLDSRDAQACFSAIKTGFISKSQKVASLTVQVFSKLTNIYEWFVNQDNKCSGTFLLGIKRHPQLRQNFWYLLLKIIKGHEQQYFTNHYASSFLDASQHVQVSAFLLKFISESSLGELLLTKGVIHSWLLVANRLPQESIPSQQIVISFIGEILLYFPSIMEQNQQYFTLLSRNWQKLTLCQFVTLTNQLIAVLEKLANIKSPMAKKVYEIFASIAKRVASGDKHDYLIQNSVLLLRKFSNIPSQHLLKQTEISCFTNSEYLLACETIQLSQDQNTLLALGFKMKSLFLQNPLLNFNLTNMLKEISLKVLHSEYGIRFIQSLIDDSLTQYTTLFLKYKSKPKQQNNVLYFGRSGSPSKVSKPQQKQLMLNQKRKELYLKLVKRLIDLAFTQQSQELKTTIKQKLMNCNSKIRLNNFKIGVKQIQQILSSRFEVQKDQQLQHLEQFKSKADNSLSDQMINRSKASLISVSLKLKGPENLTKEFQSIVQKRRVEEEQRQAYQIKKQLWEEKRKISVRKQLQIANLLRGQIGQAQLREEGFFHRLIQDSKDYDLILFEELQQTQLEAIDSLLKRYHRVLRHVFLNYSATMYSSHTIEIISDNIKRKQTLTAVELAKFLKDYGFFSQTSQPQLSSIVRDINVKIMNRREVNQLDFSGFEQFIIQFCFNSRAKSAFINKESYQSSYNSNFPVYGTLKEFFKDLKAVFAQLGQKITIFQDLEDIPLSKEQAYAISILNQKVLQNQNYILPAGYKKVAEKTVKFNNLLKDSLQGLDQSYTVVYQTLDQILANLMNVHIVQPASKKITSYKVRPLLPRASDQILQRQRANSTTILKKTSSLQESQIKRSHSKNILDSVKNLTKKSNQGEEAVNKIEELKSKQKQKQIDNQKAIERQNRNAELIKAKLQLAGERKQKETEKEKQTKKEKSQDRKKREQTQKFIEEQAVKMRMKFQQDREQQRIKSQKLAQERQQQIKQNKEKFKQIHQAQLQKIKKIELEASERHKRQEEQVTEQNQKKEQQRKKLREQIEEQDKNIIQTRKQIQTKLSELFQSEPITAIFKTYEQNLQALFEFLINRTHISLTQKKINNQIIFEVWKYFLNAFQISPLILNPKEAVSIFKSLTKDKIAPKEYHFGLTYNQFQQALFRIAVKHKTIFNIISSKIIDQIKPTQQPQTQAEKKNSVIKKGQKETNKKVTKGQRKTEMPPEQDSLPKQTDIKEILKADSSEKDQINEYGDISKASEKTLRGLIYYLKVPNNKQGQQTRFRQILTQKHSVAVQNSDKLKQKLQGVYTLQAAGKQKQKLGKSITLQSKPA